MDNTLFITRQEAADMCGVHAQTITNWSKAGLFAMTGQAGTSYVLRQSFEAWLKSMESQSLIDKAKAYLTLEQEIDDMRKEREYLHQQLKIETTNLKTRIEMSKIKGDYIRMVNAGMLEELLARLISINDKPEVSEGNRLRDREILILRSIAHGDLPSHIAELYEISPERVRQIFYRAMKRITNMAAFWNLYIDGERPRMMQRLAEQHRHIEALEHDLKTLQAESKLRITAGKTKVFDKAHSGNALPDLHGSDTQRLLWLINTPLIPFCRDHLSVRAINCLKALQAETMYDLVTTQKREIFRVRNVGKKSLLEIGDFLETLGLCFEMQFDKTETEICKSIIRETEGW